MTDTTIELQSAGFTNEQIAALNNRIDERSATKVELEKLNSKLTLAAWILTFNLAFTVAQFMRSL